MILETIHFILFRDDSFTRGQSNMRRFIYERSTTNIRDWSLAYSFIYERIRPETSPVAIKYLSHEYRTSATVTGQPRIFDIKQGYLKKSMVTRRQSRSRIPIWWPRSQDVSHGYPSTRVLFHMYLYIGILEHNPQPLHLRPVFELCVWRQVPRHRHQAGRAQSGQHLIIVCASFSKTFSFNYFQCIVQKYEFGLTKNTNIFFYLPTKNNDNNNKNKWSDMELTFLKRNYYRQTDRQIGSHRISHSIIKIVN